MALGHDSSRAKQDAGQTKASGPKRASAATAQLEAIRDVMNGVVQRTLTLQGNPISEDDAIDIVLKRLGKDAQEYAEAVAAVIRKFTEQEKVFTGDDDLFTQVMSGIDQALSPGESGSDAEREAAAFPRELWNGEPEESRQKCLNRYALGKKLREGLGSGSADKTAFAVQGNDDLAVVIRSRRLAGTATLAQEVRTLSQLAKAGLPAAQVLDCGYYVLDGIAHPAVLMTRYAMSSEAFVRRAGGEIVRPEAYKKSLGKVFATPEKIERGLQSLVAIRSRIGKDAKLAVNDIGFLVDGDGHFFINDATETGSEFQESNIQMLDELESVLKTHHQETFE